MKYQNGVHLTRPAPVRIRIAVAARRSLDLSGLISLIQESECLTLVAADRDLVKISAACADMTPDAALLDASFPNNQAFDVAQELLARGYARTVIFLDDYFAVVRAQRALAMSQATYYTRDDEFTHICAGIRELLAQQSTTKDRLDRSGHYRIPEFLLRDEQLRERNPDGFLDLSHREREVMRFLARGYTVRETAQALQLAVSTVDNHKAKIMKKLHLSHMTQITRVAMRVGLID